MGQHVTISKGKAIFAKSAEQSFSTEIFRIIKVIHRAPRRVYQKFNWGQFYGEEMTPVHITKQTQFQIDKIIATRARSGIEEHLVMWKVYSSDFDSWVPASDIKNIYKEIMEIDRKHFYVTLFSNASQKIFPDNTLVTFTIHLAQPIDLGTSSDWEVGLCENTYKPPRLELISGALIDIIRETNALIYCDLIVPQFVCKNYVRL